VASAGGELHALDQVTVSARSVASDEVGDDDDSAIPPLRAAG
jgi:hypothetical protein